MPETTQLDLKQYIREIPDFPKPGILFRDITPLLASPEAFREVIRRMA
ncbi:MAG: adenine phosphoribosyltransferase, partial [Pirellulaceae bacterium]